MDASDFIGYWKITNMDVWSRDYVDLVVPGFIEFRLDDRNVMGSFQFGTVSGYLHCHLQERNGETHIEWSWQGQSDTDPGCGRGWATVLDGELVGHIFIHCSDHSPFRATRQPRPARSKRTAKSRG